jgi:tape measure domain-containing protein
MAKLNDLIVTIGAQTRQFDKALGASMRKMQRFGKNTKDLGKSMTRSLTMPIAGLGVAAIKSAADLETMEVSFISLTGGAKQAADMMANLNEFTAKTPFQIEAVAKSARQLIASGSGIEEVNQQLQFLGDIAATSGQPIDEIAAIFSKVNAKGKVELESLNQLAERGIPIFTALAEATGLPADKLGAGRVSVDQFNEVLQSFSKEGGFAAGAMERLSETASGKFSTALDNLKLAGAGLAEDLLPVVKDLIDDFTAFTQRIQKLSPESKKLALQIAAVAAAIGPVLVIVPSLIGGIEGVAGAFSFLNKTMLNNPFAIVATGIALVVTGLIVLNSKTLETATAVEKLAQANKDLTLEEQKRNVEKAIADQQALVDLLKAEKEAKDKIAEKFGGKAIAEQKEANKAFEDANAELLEMLGLLVDIDKQFQTILSKEEQAAEALAKKMRRVFMHGIEPLTPKAIENTVVKGLQAMGTAVQDITQKAADSLARTQQTMKSFGLQMANSFQTVFSQIIEGTFNFEQSMVAMLKQVFAKAVALLVVFGLLTALTGGIGGSFFTAVEGLKGFMTAGFGIPKFAEGGIVSGPTMAMVGEYSGAANNPEVIAPLDKLQSMMGGQAVQVTGKISGRDILLTSERNAIDRNRVRGF